MMRAIRINMTRGLVQQHSSNLALFVSRQKLLQVLNGDKRLKNKTEKCARTQESMVKDRKVRMSCKLFDWRKQNYVVLINKVSRYKFCDKKIRKGVSTIFKGFWSQVFLKTFLEWTWGHALHQNY